MSETEGPIKVKVERVVLHCTGCRWLRHGLHVYSGNWGYWCDHSSHLGWWVGQTPRTRAWCHLREKAREDEQSDKKINAKGDHLLDGVEHREWPEVKE